ncbi:MAG: GNAT family N-acetyltransferase [Alphaproteobacteria bacterium]|nr:GNAT family N-acetyltransferase [Alphaproteobacteria bacterium]
MMLHIVSPASQDFYQKDLEDFFKLRKKILIDERGWNLTAEKEQEIDQFDHDQAHYLLYKPDEKGAVIGGVRLTPTLVPNLTMNIFSSLIKPERGFAPSQRIWESSRFVTASINCDKHKGIIKKATAELFVGMIEYSLLHGLESLLMLTEIRLERIGRMLQWHLDRLGDVSRVGNTLAVTGLAEISEAVLRRVRRNGGIHHEIFFLHSSHKINRFKSQCPP